MGQAWHADAKAGPETRPKAAALWQDGISFGGVVAFVFADLISLPLLSTGTPPTSAPGTAGTASPAGPAPRRVAARIRDPGAARPLRDRDRHGGTVSFPAAVTPAC